MANISSSGQVICWLLSNFFGDMLYPIFNRMRYPHRNIPHRLSRTQYPAENVTCAMKLSLLKAAAETSMEFIMSQSWLSGRSYLTTFLRSCAIY